MRLRLGFTTALKTQVDNCGLLNDLAGIGMVDECTQYLAGI